YILDRIKERKNKKIAISNSRTRAEKVQAQAEYIEANKQVRKSIRADKKKCVEEPATTAERTGREGNMKQLYDTTNKQAGKYSKSERPVKDKEVNSPDIKAAHTDLPTDVNPPTTEEIRMAVRQIKRAKAAGSNKIPAEALKSDIEVTTNMLHLLFKKIWEEEQVPMDRKEGHIIKRGLERRFVLIFLFIYFNT
ncbi:unnamed protein product, partial [Schistosoma curassoni]|uniref:Reverse transcriptase domain-containing protein n=1 Tax=Schistosoma curassoni TaxID=6186 RepID=A0A183JT61_9TREM